MSCSPAARSGGFTLMELLIALSLVGLIMMLLFGGLRLGSRSWEGIEQRVQRTEEVRLARSFLQRALLQARKVNWTLERRRFSLFFGSDHQLEFVTPLSSYVGLPGLYVVRIALVDHEERKDLVLQRWLFNPEVLGGGGEIPEWRPQSSPGTLKIPHDGPMGAYGVTLLLRGLDALELSYYGAVSPETEMSWHQEWDLQPTLPSLVKIGFGDDSEWPDLIVPLVDG
jgi:general secretion pathway protein J